MSTGLSTAVKLATFCPADADEHWIEPLKYGTHVLIRPLQEQDREREFQFIKHLSAGSRRSRFLGTFSEADAPLMDRMMDLDYQNRMAYVALVHENGQLLEIGVSRYAATPGAGQCECAITVADEWQRRGLGTLLGRHLIDAARRNGFKTMTSTDLASNYGMHCLARTLGFTSRYPSDGFSEIIHELDLEK